MKSLAIAAALTGFFSIACGAFGAHGLAPYFSVQQEDWWETATLYALVHSVAAFTAAWSGERTLRISGWAFIIGTVVFAGTLYLMALGAPRWFGAITPIGGLSFLVGWGAAFIAAIRR